MKKAFFILLMPAFLFSLGAAAKEAPAKGTISVKGHQTADYPKLARITSDQAAKSAQKAQSGKVLSSALENEDGFLIYSVQVMDQNSKKHEILVDAGNGKILASGSDDENDHDEESAD